MGHIIAGAGVGRDLAQHGADVLNIWRPNELEHDSTYNTANVGVRSSTIDPYGPEGQTKIRELLRDADLFYANRRPGYLEKIGLSAEGAAAIRPGIIHLSFSLAGETGPWADRVGFDQTAGALTGIMLMEGADGVTAGPKSTPALPYISVVNDYVLSWLATTGAVAALMRRATDGGSYRVTLNLTRIAPGSSASVSSTVTTPTRSRSTPTPTPRTRTSTRTPSPPKPPAATTRASPTRSSCPRSPAASATSCFPAAAALPSGFPGTAERHRHPVRQGGTAPLHGPGPRPCLTSARGQVHGLVPRVRMTA